MTDSPAIRPAEQVAYRALVLGAFILRGVLEQNFQTDNHLLARRTSRTGIEGLGIWMNVTSLTDHQSPAEAEQFDLALGSWPPDTISQASWQVEALGILLWALTLEAMIPTYDILFDSAALLEHIPFYDEVDAFTNHPLRAAGDLHAARETAELWHWRVRTSRLQSQGFQSNEGINLADAITERAEQGQQAGLIPPLVDGDFSAFGTSFALLDSAQLSQIAGTARVRHRALNWVCGLGDDWDTVSTNT